MGFGVRGLPAKAVISSVAFGYKDTWVCLRGKSLFAERAQFLIYQVWVILTTYRVRSDDSSRV